MRHSVYLKLATVLIRADLRREDREWKRKVRRSAYDLPWENAHLLRDIGLEVDGRPIGFSEPEAITIERRVRHLRRALSARILT